MREEYELEVLEKYDIEVKGIRRTRGAFFCDTNEGTMLLKETKISGRRAPFLYTVLHMLETEGEMKVDTPVFTHDGELIAASAEGKTYMLKKWYRGTECDIREEEMAAKACEKLGIFHRKTEKYSLWDPDSQFSDNMDIRHNLKDMQKNPAGDIAKHNRELKKVRRFIRSRPGKNEFEALFLENFERMFGIAQKVQQKMEESGCRTLYENSVKKGSLVHGDYNYHNLLTVQDDIALTGFEHMHVDIQVRDLYYFTRKVMEKHHWKQKTGQNIIGAYCNARNLLQEEKEWLGLCLAYPEKFWKVASGYYHSNKAWIPGKYVEKLMAAVRETEEKYGFLEEYFALRL